jgi:hypothetical protein
LAAAIVACSISATALVASAQQDKEAPAVTLKVTVVISRWDGDKKVGNLPFSLMAIPSRGEQAAKGQDGSATSLQMGSEVPVPSTSFTDGKRVVSYQYRTIGTNITAAGHMLDDGRFNLLISVSDSQVVGDASKGGIVGRADGPMRFQTFRSNNRLILRDGQTIQYTAASDAIGGEVIKLEVTASVVK